MIHAESVCVLSKQDADCGDAFWTDTFAFWTDTFWTDTFVYAR